MSNRLRRQVDFYRIDRALNLSWLELLVRVLVTALLSVGFPLAIGVILGNKISSLDQVFLGVLTFVSVSLVGMTHDLLRLRQQAASEVNTEYIRNEFDTGLVNIRKSYYDLISDRRIENDLLTVYFARSLKLFEETIYEAATKHDLLVDENHFSTTDMLLACFDGRPTDIVRLVQYLNDLSFMFDVWSRNYYRRMIGMIKAGHIKEVRRLFLYSDVSEMETPGAKRLLDFHARQPGYDYRVISVGDFQKFCHDKRLNENYADFGIYGDMYVYRTQSARAERIEGVFSSSERLVNGYLDLFDECWRHAMLPQRSNEKPMSLYELFEGKPLPPNLQDLYETGPVIRTIK